MASGKIAVVGKKCVACGCCVKLCRLSAIAVRGGTHAQVDETKCVGCGKCENVCPAGIIEIAARENG